jgi:hypothetical protein
METFDLLADSTEPSWWESIILSALEAFWNWLLETVDTVFQTVLDYLLAAVPDDYAANASAFKHYIEVANSWIALDYGFTMLGVFYTFLAVFVVLKFVLKLIPTVG